MLTCLFDTQLHTHVFALNIVSHICTPLLALTARAVLLVPVFVGWLHIYGCCKLLTTEWCNCALQTSACMKGALGISKPGNKPAKEVPQNVDAVVHAATLAAHELDVAEFGPRCLLY